MERGSRYDVSSGSYYVGQTGSDCLGKTRSRQVGLRRMLYRGKVMACGTGEDHGMWCREKSRYVLQSESHGMWYREGSWYVVQVMIMVCLTGEDHVMWDGKDRVKGDREDHNI